MKLKLLSVLFTTLLFISGCSAPKLIDGPDPSLLAAPLEFNLQDLSNRAIAALYEYDSGDNWKVEKCTSSEVEINLQAEPYSSDSYPETMVIAKGKAILISLERSAHELHMSTL